MCAVHCRFAGMLDTHHLDSSAVSEGSGLK
jgi:hypothetical protein